MTSTMEWIRRQYDVPARHGMRIEYDGKPATIIGTRGPYLAFRVDGEKRITADHPTYRIVYPAVPEPVRPRGWCKHCMQDRAMTADGVMGRHHWSGRNYSTYSSERWSKPCPGAGKPPWKPVRNQTHPGEQKPATRPCLHQHATTPPRGSMEQPGDCTLCGTTYEEARAEHAAGG